MMLFVGIRGHHDLEKTNSEVVVHQRIIDNSYQRMRFHNTNYGEHEFAESRDSHRDKQPSTVGDHESLAVWWRVGGTPGSGKDL